MKMTKTDVKSYKTCTHNQTKDERKQLWYICTQHGRFPLLPAPFMLQCSLFRGWQLLAKQWRKQEYKNIYTKDGRLDLSKQFSLLLTQAKYSCIYISCTHAQRVLEEGRIFSTICILTIIKAQITLSQILLEITRCSSSVYNYYLHTKQQNYDQLHPTPVLVMHDTIKATYPRLYEMVGNTSQIYFECSLPKFRTRKKKVERYKNGYPFDSETYFTMENFRKLPLDGCVKTKYHIHLIL